MKNIEYLIEKYPEIFKDYEGNPGRVNWDCPTGWIDMVDIGLGLIQSHIDNILHWDKEKDREISITQLTCIQIKEKFGGLRFYTNGGDNYCEGITSFMESLSYDTCEQCGSNENIGYTQGWISTVCEKCKDKYKHKWTPKNKEK